jgi:hypothetical protein
MPNVDSTPSIHLPGMKVRRSFGFAHKRTIRRGGRALTWASSGSASRDGFGRKDSRRQRIELGPRSSTTPRGIDRLHAQSAARSRGCSVDKLGSRVTRSVGSALASAGSVGRENSLRDRLAGAARVKLEASVAFAHAAFFHAMPPECAHGWIAVAALVRGAWGTFAVGWR